MTDTLIKILNDLEQSTDRTQQALHLFSSELKQIKDRLQEQLVHLETTSNIQRRRSQR